MKKEIKVNQVWQDRQDGSLIQVIIKLDNVIGYCVLSSKNRNLHLICSIETWHDRFMFVAENLSLLRINLIQFKTNTSDKSYDEENQKEPHARLTASDICQQGLWVCKATGQVYQFQRMNREIMDIFIKPNIHTMLPGSVFLELRDIDTHEVIKVDSVDFFKHFKKVSESDELDTDLPVKHANLTASDICQQAIETMKERGKTYDKSNGAERSMLKTVIAFNALTGHELTEEQGWQFMTVLKLARSQQGEYKADNYLDGTAYFALAGECASVERKHDLH